MWVNIDFQAPNKVVKEWLVKQGYDCIKPEYAFGNSRIAGWIGWKSQEKMSLEGKALREREIYDTRN